MKVELPREYIIQQIFQYAGYPKVQAGTGNISCGCPACREGSSWNSKRRLYYLPKNDFFHCKNCNRSWTPISWIMEFSGKSFREVLNESKEYEYIPADLIYKEQSSAPIVVDDLPKDAINLFDPVQIDFYKSNSVVNEALQLIRLRKLNSAINKPNTFYLSLTDYVHKNRLCIPFVGVDNKVKFYQTRTILRSDDEAGIPKYLGKFTGEKTVFGINNISTDLDYIFKFEGPLDATFVKNGVALAGVKMSGTQSHELMNFPFHEQIWVFDNQHVDQTARKRTVESIDAGDKVFIWPKCTDVKDFNDLALKSDINEIPTKFILQNSFSGLQAKLKIKQFGF